MTQPSETTDDEVLFNVVKQCAEAQELAGQQQARIAELEQQLEVAMPYMQAVKESHNGYDPSAREAMPDLVEPANPKEAIASLLRECEEMKSAEFELLERQLEELTLDRDDHMKQRSILATDLVNLADGKEVVTHLAECVREQLEAAKKDAELHIEKNRTLRAVVRQMQLKAEQFNSQLFATGLIVNCTGCIWGAPHGFEDLTDERVEEVVRISNRLKEWWRVNKHKIDAARKGE